MFQWGPVIGVLGYYHYMSHLNHVTLQECLKLNLFLWWAVECDLWEEDVKNLCMRGKFIRTLRDGLADESEALISATEHIVQRSEKVKKQKPPNLQKLQQRFAEAWENSLYRNILMQCVWVCEFSSSLSLWWLDNQRTFNPHILFPLKCTTEFWPNLKKIGLIFESSSLYWEFSIFIFFPIFFPLLFNCPGPFFLETCFWYQIQNCTYLFIYFSKIIFLSFNMLCCLWTIINQI